MRGHSVQSCKLAYVHFVVPATPSMFTMLAESERDGRAGVELVQAIDARCRPVVTV